MFILALASHAQGEKLSVLHAVGGKADALEIYDAYWYQALGDKLVVIHKQTGKQVATQMLTPYVGASYCKDMLICKSELFVLLNSGEIVLFSLERPNVPRFLRRIQPNEMGIEPSQLAQVGDWPVALGEGGVVQLTDARHLVKCTDIVTGVALSIDRGLVYCANQQIVDADTGEVVGQASKLVELDDDANADFGASVYIKQIHGKTELGILSSSMQRVLSPTSTVVLEGEFQNILSRSSRLLVATDCAVYVVGVAPAELRILRTIDIEGVIDADIIASNYLAMCGDFGRGIYRIQDDNGGAGGRLIRITPATGKMAPGVADIRSMHIPSGNTSLQYGFDRSMILLDTPAVTITAPTTAIVLGLEATIVDATGEVALCEFKRGHNAYHFVIKGNHSCTNRRCDLDRHRTWCARGKAWSR